jgi:RNA polymerase sigma-70 factor, ECF subfamily
MMMREINTEIIKRAQKGDAETVSILYERYHRMIFRYLYYRVGDRSLAEDLTSEVFVRMLRFLGGFKPPAASFQAWLFQIARHLAIDHYRKPSARNHLQLEENMKNDEQNLEDAVDRIITSERLSRALDDLTEEQRDVIILRFISEMPISDVAQALNKSEDAIKGLQRRALMALRDVLRVREGFYA